MSLKPSDTTLVRYFPPKTRYAKLPTESVVPIGIDTEAYDDGQVMMICTSLGETILPEEWPAKIFQRKYRSATMVAYNLKYDAGALLQHLPREPLQELRATGRCKHLEYEYRVIANKMLSIHKGHHYVTIFDIMQYYGGSLDYNAKKYLGDEKEDMETKSFSREFVSKNWDRIESYCLHDAILTGRLAQRFIDQLVSWGMHVKKLYSTAWVSYAWFSAKCGHPSVKAFWLYDRRVLDYAMRAYNGGKFEVTTKGSSYLYEYDIVSAYPSTIARLLDLYSVGVAWKTTYQKDAEYAFLDVKMKIPVDLPSPVAVKDQGRNLYPSGTIEKTITKVEYDYLLANGADITIKNACWLIPDNKKYPYKEEIERLVALKQEYKHGDEMAYHTVKILLNSLYGKFIQLIDTPDGKWRAGSSWNPIYGSVITAETRTRISDLQRLHPSIWAVHTDSIISDTALPYPKSSTLGALSYEIEGEGIIAGCGIYEIGGKTAIRGVPSKVTLRDIAMRGGKTADVSSMQPLSWRVVLQRNFEPDQINFWMHQLKRLNPAMDSKRVWIDDWTDWSQVLTQRVMSTPFYMF